MIDAFDVGTGGGFYVDALEPRWSVAPAKRYPTLHQRQSSNTSHGEGVATYHGLRRQNGDHRAVTSVFIGMAPPVAGIASTAGDGSATDHGRGIDPGSCRIRADRRRRGGVL